MCVQSPNVCSQSVLQQALTLLRNSLGWWGGGGGGGYIRENIILYAVYSESLYKSNRIIIYKRESTS